MPVLPPTELSTWGQQRRRHLDEVDAPQGHRRREAGQITHDPAAEGDQAVPALDAVAEDTAQQRFQLGEGLARLAGRHLEHLRGDAGTAQGAQQALAMQRGDRRIGDDNGPRPAQERRHQFAGPVDQARADQDIVAPVAQIDPDGLKRNRRVVAPLCHAHAASPKMGGETVYHPVDHLLPRDIAAVDDQIGLSIDRVAVRHQPLQDLARVALAQQRPIIAPGAAVHQELQIRPEPDGNAVLGDG